MEPRPKTIITEGLFSSWWKSCDPFSSLRLFCSNSPKPFVLWNPSLPSFMIPLECFSALLCPLLHVNEALMNVMMRENRRDSEVGTRRGGKPMGENKDFGYNYNCKPEIKNILEPNRWNNWYKSCLDKYKGNNFRLNGGKVELKNVSWWGIDFINST